MNLDDLKKKLFEALPPALREKLGIKLDRHDDDDDEEYIDEDEATASHELEPGEKTQTDIDGDEEEVDEEEDDEEAAKKKKTSKIIRYVVIGAIILGIADEFFQIFSPGVDENAVPEVKIVRPKRPPVEPPAQGGEQTPPQEQQPVAVETPVMEQTPVAEVTPEEVPTFEPTPMAETTPEETQQEETAPIFNFEEETPVADVPPETATEILPPAVDSPSESTSIDDLIKAVDKSSELATKEASKEKGSRDDPTYVEPPNYTRSGRGLVYNCRDRHWACVDKFSYFTCFENQKWNEKNNQAAECVTRDVYASVNDCTAIQKFYVNKPEPVDFCGDEVISEKPSEKEVLPEQQDISNIIVQ